MRAPRVALLLAVAVLAGCASPVHVASVEGRTGEEFARAFILTDPFPDLLVELDYDPAFPPSQDALEHARAALREVLPKREIRIVATQLPASFGARDWTRDELIALDAQTIDSRKPEALGEGEAAVIHVLYLDGRYDSGEGDVLGVAFKNVAFLFRDVDEVARLIPQGPADPEVLVERTVLLHEIGHIIGLVNRGVPMVKDHEHATVDHHSSNPESVMWSGVDTMEAYYGLIDEGRAPPSAFDADDVADIRAFVLDNA